MKGATGNRNGKEETVMYGGVNVLKISNKFLTEASYSSSRRAAIKRLTFTRSFFSPILLRKPVPNVMDQEFDFMIPGNRLLRGWELVGGNIQPM